MRVHAQKQNQSQRPGLPNLITSNAKPLAAGHGVHSLRPFDTRAPRSGVGPDTSATPHFTHDFSGIAVHSTAPVRVQAKLKLNTPGDKYEEEADRVADQVTSMPESPGRRTCACGGECPKCLDKQASHEHTPIRGPDPEKMVAPPIVSEVLQASSHPLDPSTQEFMESRFGHDFSQVRVHADTRATESAAAVNALAYTVGRHIVFGPGQYRPETTPGKKLLAHELTHTVQQTNGVQNKLAVNRPGDRYEQEADRAALAIILDKPLGIFGQTGAPVMRQLMRQKEKQSEVQEPQEDPRGKPPAVDDHTTFNHELVSSDLDKLHKLEISGSMFSASSDAATLANGIRTLRSVIQMAGNLSISQQGAETINSKVVALDANLNTDVTLPPSLRKQQAALAGFSAASLTGAESVGLPILLEVLAEIVAVIAAILEAPIVIIIALIALIVLVVYLIYDLIKSIVNEAERAMCISDFGRCIPRTGRKDDQSCSQCLWKCIHQGGWPANECPLRK